MSEEDQARVLMEAKGLHGQIELLRGTVRIRRKGFLAMAKGRDKEIPVRKISSVQFGDAGLIRHGYVRFIPGQETEKNQPQAYRDEFTVLFHFWERKSFKAVKQAVERQMAES